MRSTLRDSDDEESQLHRLTWNDIKSQFTNGEGEIVTPENPIGESRIFREHIKSSNSVPKDIYNRVNEVKPGGANYYTQSGWLRAGKAHNAGDGEAMVTSVQYFASIKVAEAGE